MQVTSPYWFQPEFKPVLRDKPIVGHLGFKTSIPWPAPVTVGAMYFGEGALPDRRTVETSPFGEYFAVNNTVPSSGGVALYDTSDPIFTHSRERFVYRI